MTQTVNTAESVRPLCVTAFIAPQSLISLPVSASKMLTEQYAAMKAKHPDAILLFRCGDFYECFAEDAVTCADILQITLTRRMNGPKKSVELAGFPHHALDTYLPKLVRAGKRVAICEQLEEPKAKKAKKAKED